MFLILLQNERKLNPLIRNSDWPWNKLKPFCTEKLDSLKFLICKYPKVFPFPYWLIVVDLLIILRFMFASLHTAMISKSLNVPIPVDLNQSLRSVLDCYHWSPQSKRHSIQGRGNRRKWQLLMYFDFDQGFLDVYSDVLLKLILMIFLIGKVTFPPRKRTDCYDFGRVFPVKELKEGEIPGCWTIDVHCSVQEEQETVSRRFITLELSPEHSEI